MLYDVWVIFMSKIDYSGWSKEELIREIEKIRDIKKYGIVWYEKIMPLAKAIH